MTTKITNKRWFKEKKKKEKKKYEEAEYTVKTKIKLKEFLK